MQRAATPLLDRRYEITAILAEQPYERHYAARHVELAMPVRIVVRERPRSGPAVGARAHVGAGAAAGGRHVTGSWPSVSLLTNLRHPVLPRVRDCFRHDTLYYVVMDEVGGESISAWLARGCRLSPRQALSIGLQLCDALAYLADVAPSLLPLANITPDTVALLPSGGVALSCLPAGRWLGTSDEPASPGDPLYAAPELLTGEHADARVDLYSVAALLYTLLSPKPAAPLGCPRPPLAEAAPHLPPVLVAAVEQALHADPNRRFASAVELGTALAACAYSLLPASVPSARLAFEPISAPVRRAVPPARRQSRRPPNPIPSDLDRRWLRALGGWRMDSTRQPSLLRTGERALAALSSALHRSA